MKPVMFYKLRKKQTPSDKRGASPRSRVANVLDSAASSKSSRAFTFTFRLIPNCDSHEYQYPIQLWVK